ncbi:MAG: protease IV [Gammaproteobacteria bacterium]|nr:MAG: protease IV [Gammaproteobacteria bacterium]TND06852.1 MAG: protease IV [Gammaproteobacteria bacterium]
MINNGSKEEPHFSANGVESTEPPSGRGDQVTWEREVIERLATFGLKEQRSRRRWGIFFKVLLVAYILVLSWQALPRFFGDDALTGGKHTALVDIYGEISDAAEANADSVILGLRDAFEDKQTAGVILRINSPGGSPVQAGYVNDEMTRLRGLYPNIPLYVVITDMCASGGYYIAAAADKIYADKASIVGSIGVLMNGFGFVGALDKLGIERRLLTAGEHKGFLDPFSPAKDDDIRHIKGLLSSIHAQFIATVKKGRGDRLKDSPEIFSGLVWTGEQGIALGLVDGLGNSSYVAREVIGEKKIVDYTHRPPLFDRFVERIGVTLVRVAGLTQMRLN